MLLIHRNPENCDLSKLYIEQLKKLSKNKKYSEVKFFILNGIKNDYNHFVENLPSFLIFVDGQFEFPLVYDHQELDELESLLENRNDYKMNIDELHSGDFEIDFGDMDMDQEFEDEEDYDYGDHEQFMEEDFTDDQRLDVEDFEDEE